jgi:hypothetical protein
MIIVLAILHGLIAAALLGAVTHQVLAFRRVAPAVGSGFFVRLGALRPAVYANAVVAMYVVDFMLGAVIYTSYRVDVRPYLEDVNLFLAAGAFETKEHLAVLGLGLLPAYWSFWKVPRLADQTFARMFVTGLLAFYVWWNFLVGHIVNNIRGVLA